MPELNEHSTSRIPLSELAARLRLQPGQVYARAVRLGIVVSRTARVASVSVEDAERIETAAQELTA